MEQASNGSAPDAVTLLKSDHRKVEALFKQFEAAEDKREKAALMQQICMELDIHARIEEKFLYPRGEKVDEAEDPVHEGMVEHEGIKRLVRQLKTLRPSDKLFDARAKVLKEYVMHHVREEETSMFPKLKDAGLDLQKIGRELQAMKQRLTRRAESSHRGRRMASSASATESRHSA